MTRQPHQSIEDATTKPAAGSTAPFRGLADWPRGMASSGAAGVRGGNTLRAWADEVDTALHTAQGAAPEQALAEEADAEAFVSAEHAAADQYLADEWSHYAISDETRAIVRSAWTERASRAAEAEQQGKKP